MESSTTSLTTEANGLDVIQSMIDISADRLEGLRTQCATSASLTQQEIRCLETKLVRMFSELLITKARLPERVPSNGLSGSGAELRQWLRVVGLSHESLNLCLQKIETLEQLLEKNDDDLKELVSNSVNVREDVRRLTSSMQCLRSCRKTLAEGSKEPDTLYWDSWDRHHHTHHHHRGSTGNTSSHLISSSGSNSSPRTHRLVKQPHCQKRQSPNEVVQSPVGSAPNMGGTSSNVTTPDDVTQSSIHNLTPSPSPPNSPGLTNLSSSSSNSTNQKLSHRKSGTPPPKKKHQTHLSHHPATPSHNQSNSGSVGTPTGVTSSGSNNSTPTTLTGSGVGSLPDPLSPIIKSKSHESQLLHDNSSSQSNSSLSSNNAQQNHDSVPVQPHIVPRTRLHTEPGPDLPSHAGYYTEVENTNNLTVPRSPCTPIVPLGMGHMIAHRFAYNFKVMSTCDLCQKQVFFGLKCKECKYRCHKDCEPNVPPSCGLPREFVDEFKKTLQSSEGFIPNTSPQLSSRSSFLTTRRQKGSMAQCHAPDSSSPGSSCNSSSPSSPALFGINQNSHGYSQHSSSSNTSQPLTTPSPALKQTIQFNFPDVKSPTTIIATSNPHTTHQIPGVTIETHPLNNISVSVTNCNSVTISNNLVDDGSNNNNNNNKLSNFRGSRLSNPNNIMRPPLSELSDTHRSNDSDKTVSLSGSTSASTDSDRTPIRLDSTEEGDSGNWPRQNSLSLKEWDIPYDDLHILEKIGKGRFGTVHRALWHGDVAVKLLKEDYDERTLEAFKLEVATFKKTRHENLVLFMGACMKPPFLAIVTSLCKGNTLYTYIHLRRDKFNLNRTTLVAQQISQGMGYLHARGIFHKDLRTKNIFLENGKVIITDFGLFSSTKLFYCDLGLGIPNSWLCYLAPELMRSLTPYRPSEEILPFSCASDVYSFGTVWYELLCGEFPYKMQPPESIIWQVGRGMKQTLANLQTSRDVKDILMLCWSFQADDRPEFAKLLTLLERLPKKRLARSPSHPVQLSRSAESVF